MSDDAHATVTGGDDCMMRGMIVAELEENNQAD